MPTLSNSAIPEADRLKGKFHRVYRRDTGVYVGSAVSDPTTGLFSITTADTAEHFAIAHDGQGDPYWDNIVLNMPMEGANNSTVFTDLRGKVVTAVGGAKLTTTLSRHGSSSAFLDGAGDCLSIPESEDWRFGTGDFTVEVSAYATSFPANYAGQYQACLVANYKYGAGSTNYGWSVIMVGTASSYTGLMVYSGATLYSFNYAFALGVWYDIAVSKVGNTLYVFVNGALIGSTTTSDSFSESGDIPRPLFIGALNDPTYCYYFSGYLDAIRITNGGGRHAAPYTPDPSSFTRALAGGTENALIYDRLTPI